MNHLPSLISDLALILTVAAITSLIFRWLRQPLILGYLVAGFLVGPQFSWLPTVTDLKGVQVWAEIGVIFLLFSMGLEFGWGKFKKIGPSALITGSFEVISMLCVGFIAGKVFGWSNIASLFLGSTIAVSSTSIALKTFDELQVKHKKFSELVLGVLIIEDLFAIIILVALTTFSLGQSFQGSELFFEAGKLMMFLVAWFVSGIFLIPWLLRSVKSFLTDETVLVFSLGLCFLLAVSASTLGFSSALGAFLMGSILGETDERKKIESLLLPVKNLFAAIFFVSVGMMLDLKSVSDSPLLWGSMLGLLVIGKIFFVTTGALAAGQDERTASKMGISMAHIGEFSFIIASLGLTLGVTGKELYSSVILIATITSFTTPYFVKYRDQIASFVSMLIPQAAHRIINQYVRFSFVAGARVEWTRIINNYVINLGINTIIVILAIVLVQQIFVPFLWLQNFSETFISITSFVVTVLIASPFLWAIVFSRSKDPLTKNFWDNEVNTKAKIVMLVLRITLAIGLLLSMIAQFVDFKNLLTVLGLSVVIFGYALSRYIGKIYLWFEGRFLGQLDNQNNASASVLLKKVKDLAPWDAHLSELIIPAEFPQVGLPLVNLNLREKFGIIIALIQRGEKVITAPGRNDSLMPFDRLYVIGTDEQIDAFERHLISKPNQEFSSSIDDYSLQQYYVANSSPFRSKIIRESGIRELTTGLVVGIEREGQRILNPDSGLEIKEGDVLWLVGDRQKIKSLES